MEHPFPSASRSEPLPRGGAGGGRKLAILAVIDSRDKDSLERLREFLPNTHLLALGPAGHAFPAGRQSDKLYLGTFPLTDRQSDILNHLISGLSNKEIGRRLGISPFTVRNHVSKLLQILQFPSRRHVRLLADASAGEQSEAALEGV